MTELAPLREQYRAGKVALLVSLANSGASARGIRSLLHRLARHTDATLRRHLIEYSTYYRKLYDAACEVSGAKVVVDSSKVAPTAMALSHHRHIDLRVLHIVRDSRGVAHSWAKVVARPESLEGAEMPRLDARQSTTLWLAHNLSMTGLAYRGVPYRTGGADPDEGFDCSGLVWYVFAQNGRFVPRTVAELFRTGTAVEGSELRAGDLVFFNTTGVSPSHVGIALGGEGFVHAPSTSGEVRVERLDTRYWSGRLVGVRRIE